MDASIDFSGVLRGSIADGGGGGGGDSVVITPLVTSGTKIADVSVNGVDADLYAPNPTEVTVDQEQQSGTKIGSIEVNGVEVDLYAPNPTQVTVEQVQESGTKIATIGVNGQSTDIYAPEGGGHEYSTTERKIGKFLGQDLYEITIDFGSNISFDADWNLTNIAHENKYSLVFAGKLISTEKLSYNVDVASNDTTYIEIRPNLSCRGRYLIFSYTKNI